MMQFDLATMALTKSLHMALKNRPAVSVMRGFLIPTLQRPCFSGDGMVANAYIFTKVLNRGEAHIIHFS